MLILIFKYGKSLVLFYIITLTAYKKNDFKKFNTKKFTTKYKKLIKIFIINNKANKKAVKFWKFILKFNVYLKLYYYLITLEFVVLFNYTTFFNKNKY